MSRPWSGYKTAAPGRTGHPPVLYAGTMGNHCQAVPALARDPHKRVDSDSRRRRARRVRSPYAGVGRDRYTELGAS